MTACRSSGDWAIGQPIRSPIARASSIARETKSRTRSSSSAGPVEALVSAQIGLSVRLPHSLYQTSSRTRAEVVTSKPPARSTAASAPSRAEDDPSSSPMISPFPLRHDTSPGAGDAADRCTVPPMTRAAGSADAISPPGSTLSR